MANPQFKWTPKGEASTESLDLDLYGARGLQQLRGWRQTDERASVSSGGVAVTLVHDAWWEYELKLDAINRQNNALIFQRLSSFTAHVLAGGLFAFSIDSAKTLSTLLNGAVVKGATTIVVDDDAGVAIGDDLFLEDATDPTRWQIYRTTGTGGSNSWNSSHGTSFGFPDNTPVFAFEHFPTCRANGRNPVRLFERAAGKGADLWDFRLRFRTVRG